MNLVGKILVVLIFIASVCFMAFAVAVHATHVNWRDMVLRSEASPSAPLGLKFQLEQADARFRALQAERAALETQLNREIAMREQRLGQLQTAVTELKLRRDQLEANEAQLNSQMRDAVDRAKAAEDRLVTNQKEIEQLRAENVLARKNRDETFETAAPARGRTCPAEGRLRPLESSQHPVVGTGHFAATGFARRQHPARPHRSAPAQG